MIRVEIPHWNLIFEMEQGEVTKVISDHAERDMVTVQELIENVQLGPLGDYIPDRDKRIILALGETMEAEILENHPREYPTVH
jgi:hypothetical protein